MNLGWFNYSEPTRSRSQFITVRLEMVEVVRALPVISCRGALNASRIPILTVSANRRATGVQAPPADNDASKARSSGLRDFMGRAVAARALSLRLTDHFGGAARYSIV